MNRTLRKNTKNTLQKALGGDIVSDREVQSFEDQSRSAAEAGLKAQQAALNQQAAAAGEGSVSQQVVTDAAQDAQAQASEAAIQAAGQAESYREGATQQRTQQALSQADAQRAEDTRRRQTAMKYSFDLADVVGAQLTKRL